MRKVGLQEARPGGLWVAGSGEEGGQDASRKKEPRAEDNPQITRVRRRSHAPHLFPKVSALLGKLGDELKHGLGRDLRSYRQQLPEVSQEAGDTEMVDQGTPALWGGGEYCHEKATRSSTAR